MTLYIGTFHIAIMGGTTHSIMEDGITVHHGTALGTTTAGTIHGTITVGIAHGIMTAGITHGTTTAGISEVGTTLITEDGTEDSMVDSMVDSMASGIHSGITIDQATLATFQAIQESLTENTTTPLDVRPKSRLQTPLSTELTQSEEEAAQVQPHLEAP